MDWVPSINPSLMLADWPDLLLCWLYLFKWLPDCCGAQSASWRSSRKRPCDFFVYTFIFGSQHQRSFTVTAVVGSRLLFSDVNSHSLLKWPESQCEMSVLTCWWSHHANTSGPSNQQSSTDLLSHNVPLVTHGTQLPHSLVYGTLQPRIDDWPSQPAGCILSANTA